MLQQRFHVLRAFFIISSRKHTDNHVLHVQVALADCHAAHQGEVCVVLLVLLPNFDVEDCACDLHVRLKQVHWAVLLATQQERNTPAELGTRTAQHWLPSFFKRIRNKNAHTLHSQHLSCNVRLLDCWLAGLMACWIDFLLACSRAQKPHRHRDMPCRNKQDQRQTTKKTRRQEGKKPTKQKHTPNPSPSLMV